MGASSGVRASGRFPGSAGFQPALGRGPAIVHAGWKPALPGRLAQDLAQLQMEWCLERGSGPWGWFRPRRPGGGQGGRVSREYVLSVIRHAGRLAKALAPGTILSAATVMVAARAVQGRRLCSDRYRGGVTGRGDVLRRI